MELYFSNKQGSPENKSQKVDLSINEENNTIAQLWSNKQIDLNSSKGTEVNESFQNNVIGKQSYLLNKIIRYLKVIYERSSEISC